MFYCFVYPESIDKILEKDFVRGEHPEEVEVSKYGNNIFTYKSSKLSIYVNNELYSLDNPEFRLDNLIRSVQLTYYEYSSKIQEAEKIHSDDEFEAFTGNNEIRFTAAKATSNGRKLGNFFVYKSLRSKLALKDILKKYQITEVESEPSEELNIIKLLIKLEKF